jgi:hypothetical protein
MFTRSRPFRAPIAWYQGRHWMLAVCCYSLCAVTARALDLPDPYSSFGLPRASPPPPPAYRSFGSVPRAEERFIAEQPRLPLLGESTFWQRLADYKVHGGIRVLTLLNLNGSTIALQAGHGARPSLQWTSRTVRAGSAARGLLDRFFSVASRPLEAHLQRREPEVAPRRAIGQ